MHGKLGSCAILRASSSSTSLAAGPLELNWPLDTTMPLVMLDTVPAGVRELATSQQWLEKLTAGHPQLGIRLVSTAYPDMRDAWARVCEHADPEVPTFFFHVALELSATWKLLPKAGRKRYQANVARIAAAAEDVAGLLERHEAEIHFVRGSRLTFHHVAVRARTIQQ